jgi:hypothetical protein
MGIITDGKEGQELAPTLDRLRAKYGVTIIRSDTATFRDVEFNAVAVVDAVERVKTKAWGYVGYSQGCMNALRMESLLLSGTPSQRKLLSGLTSRLMLYSAANGALHAQSVEWKISNALVEMEDVLKRLQAVISKPLIEAGLKFMQVALASRPVLNLFNVETCMQPWAAHSYWRDFQYLDVPTMKIQGIAERDNIPEVLDMLSNAVTHELGHENHDTQVSVDESQVKPMMTRNACSDRFARTVIPSKVQRAHHWSILDKEVIGVRTARDQARRIFDSPKDRHVFPWFEVCARFGTIPKANDDTRRGGGVLISSEWTNPFGVKQAV